MKRFLVPATAIVILALLAACENPAAKEEPKEYSVTYDPNFATGGTAPAAQTKEPGEPLTLAANSGALVREGFSFAGWNAMANGYGTDYAPGANYGTEAPLKLYAKWNIVPAGGGGGDFEFKGLWNACAGEMVFGDMAFTNQGITIQADFPDVVYSYNNTGDTAVLFWRWTGEFAKISWTPTACGGYRVLHSSPVANLSLLDTADPDKLEYYLVPEYTTAPAILSSVPAEGASVPKSTTSMSITFDHLMGSRVSCTPSGAVVASPPSTTWSHNFELGRSTLTLGNLQFSETPGPVSIQFFPAMTDCDGNALGGDMTISFTTTD